MTRWKLTIEYNGAEYYGWQRQPEEFPTVQREVERAITAFCQQEIEVQASGRTDAGVHARGQVVHFDLDYGDRALDGYGLAKALNAHLRPAPIVVVDAVAVDDDFNARFSAKNKLYHYRIVNRGAFLALEAGLALHVRRPLDVVAMDEAAQILIGQHDFTTFRDAECQAKSPVRTVDKISVTARDYDGFGGREVVIAVEAMSFLHHMVRNIAGTLIYVGEGKWSAEDVRNALAAKDRRKGGPTAPAEGLYMMRVDYKEEGTANGHE